MTSIIHRTKVHYKQWVSA